MASNPNARETGTAVLDAAPSVEEKLQQAEAVIAELRGQLADVAFAEELRQALVRMGAAGQLAPPVAHDELIRLLVKTATHVLSAQGAALFLIDAETNELVLDVTIGEARGFCVPVGLRLPAGEGIVGWVAATGQPAAVADAAKDPRFAADFARCTGYVPKSVLCIPLRSPETVVGVIGLYDKAKGQPFSADDMEVLGQFASAAAIAIEQSRVVRGLTELFRVVLQGLLPGNTEEEALRRELEGQAAEFARRTVQSDRYRDALRITYLVCEISRHDPGARRLCEEVLASVRTYVRARSSRNPGGGWPR